MMDDRDDDDDDDDDNDDNYHRKLTMIINDNYHRKTPFSTGQWFWSQASALFSP